MATHKDQASFASESAKNFKGGREGGTVLHRSICNVFWGLGGRSYTIMIWVSNEDFLYLV